MSGTRNLGCIVLLPDGLHRWYCCLGGQKLRGDLLDHALRAAGVHADEGVDQAEVELGAHRRAAREPIELAPRDREVVGVGGEGQDLLAGAVRWSLCEEGDLELALGCREDRGREWLVGRDGADLGGGAHEAADLEAEARRQGLVHALRESGFGSTVDVEDQVAAGAEVGDVRESAALEAGCKLRAAGAPAADVDGPQERDVARHGPIVFTAPRGRRFAGRHAVKAGPAPGQADVRLAAARYEELFTGRCTLHVPAEAVAEVVCADYV